MPSQSPQQLAVIFDIARELTAADRAIYLDRECSGNPELRRQVEQLLAHDQTHDEFLERPACEEMTSEQWEEVKDIFQQVLKHSAPDSPTLPVPVSSDNVVRAEVA